MHLAEPTLK